MTAKGKPTNGTRPIEASPLQPDGALLGTSEYSRRMSIIGALQSEFLRSILIDVERVAGYIGLSGASDGGYVKVTVRLGDRSAERRCYTTEQLEEALLAFHKACGPDTELLGE